MLTSCTSFATLPPNCTLTSLDVALGVVDDVVEDASGDGVDVLALAPFRRSLREQRGEDPGGFHAVGDVRLAAAPVLAVVPALGEERRSDNLRVAEYRVRGAVHAAQHDDVVGVGIVLRVLAEHELLAHAFPQLRHQEEAGDWEEDPGGGEHGEHVDVEADGVVVGEAREEVRVGVEVEGVRWEVTLGTAAVITASIVSPIASAVPSTRSARSPGSPRRATREIFRGVPIRAVRARPRPTPRSRRFGGRRGPRPRRQRAGTAGSAHLPRRRVLPRDNFSRQTREPPGASPAPPRARLFAHDATAGGAWNVGSRRRARVDGAPAHVSARAAGCRERFGRRRRDAVEGTRAVESLKVPGVQRCAASLGRTDTGPNQGSGPRNLTRLENTC